MIEINLKPESIFQIGSFNITNTILTTWLTVFILLIWGAFIGYQFKRSRNSLFVAGTRILVKFFYKFISDILGNKKLTWEVLPLILTIFLFITFANWIGLIPGFVGSFFLKIGSKKIPLFRTVNSDLNTTFALAISGIILIKLVARRYPEQKSYLKIGVNKLFKLVIDFFEMLSEFTRVLSLSFRLFGNIFAGEVLMIITAFILPYFLPIPFMFLEVFIGVFQAVIFAILVLVFIKW